MIEDAKDALSLVDYDDCYRFEELLAIFQDLGFVLSLSENEAVRLEEIEFFVMSENSHRTDPMFKTP